MREVLKKVCLIMCHEGQAREAWRLASVWKEVEVKNAIVVEAGFRLLQKRHVLEALCRTRNRFERHCLMQLMLLAPEEAMVEMEYRGSVTPQTFADVHAMFGERMHTTLKAIPRRTAFTYQLVQRRKAKESETRAVVNGEVVRRWFVSLANTVMALQFMEVWRHVQEASIPEERTSLLECGTHDETPRKWIMDVDASMVELEKKGLWSKKEPDVQRAKLHAETMAMTVEVVARLTRLGYLHRPCHFTVLTRHSKRKLSWHVTLNALATHEQWRQAMEKVEAEKLGGMFEFVDPSTRKNSKGQYMQVLGSMKVAAGVRAEDARFEAVGVFDGAGGEVGVPASRRPTLLMAASSLVIQDPWSIPFAGGLVEPQVVCKVSRKRKVEELPPVARLENSKHGLMGLTQWCVLPSEEAEWMRALVERKDGSTRLVTIPSMSRVEYWCQEVTALVNAGCGVLKVYAKVCNPAVCPKHLKANKRLYQHGSNHCMMLVMEQSHAMCKQKSFRMFLRCFSLKCKDMKCTHCSGGWVEMERSDYVVLRGLDVLHTGRKGESGPQGSTGYATTRVPGGEVKMV